MQRRHPSAYPRRSEARAGDLADDGVVVTCAVLPDVGPGRREADLDERADGPETAAGGRVQDERFAPGEREHVVVGERPDREEGILDSTRRGRGQLGRV